MSPTCCSRWQKQEEVWRQHHSLWIYQPRTPGGRAWQDVTGTEAWEQGRGVPGTSPSPAPCPEPPALSTAAAPACAPVSDGSDGTDLQRGKLLWEEGPCPTHSLMLQLSIPLSSCLLQPCGEHAGTPRRLTQGQCRHREQSSCWLWSRTALLGLHTRFLSTQPGPEELTAGQPGLPSSPQSVLQSFCSLLHSELKAVSDKAAEGSHENVFLPV